MFVPSLRLNFSAPLFGRARLLHRHGALGDFRLVVVSGGRPSLRTRRRHCDGDGEGERRPSVRDLARFWLVAHATRSVRRPSRRPDVRRATVKVRSAGRVVLGHEEASAPGNGEGSMRVKSHRPRAQDRGARLTANLMKRPEKLAWYEERRRLAINRDNLIKQKVRRIFHRYPLRIFERISGAAPTRQPCQLWSGGGFFSAGSAETEPQLQGLLTRPSGINDTGIQVGQSASGAHAPGGR